MCFARSLICGCVLIVFDIKDNLRRLAAPRPQSCSWASPYRLCSRASPCRRGACCLSWLSSWLRIHRSLVLPRRGRGWLLPLHQPLEIGGTQAPRSPDETTSLPWLTGFSQLLTMNTEQSNQTRRRISNFSNLGCSRSCRFRSVRRHFISSTFIAVGEAQAEMRLKWLSDRLLLLTAPAPSTFSRLPTCTNQKRRLKQIRAHLTSSSDVAISRLRRIAVLECTTVHVFRMLLSTHPKSLVSRLGYARFEGDLPRCGCPREKPSLPL